MGSRATPWWQVGGSVYTLRDGKIAELEVLPFDADSWDEFWSEDWVSVSSRRRLAHTRTNTPSRLAGAYWHLVG